MTVPRAAQNGRRTAAPLWTEPGRPAACPACGDPWVLARTGFQDETATCRRCGWHERRQLVVPPPPDHPDYQGLRLDGPLEEFRAAVDLLEAETVPESYWQKVVAGRRQRGHRNGNGPRPGGRAR